MNNHAYDYDRRNVTVLEAGNGSLLIEETTSGPSTRFVYDMDRHTHQAIIPRQSREYLAALLNASILSVRSAVEGFFVASDRYLSDFLDVLDRRGIRYTYLEDVAEIVRFRPDRAS